MNSCVLYVAERHVERLIQVNLERQRCVIHVARDVAEALAEVREHIPDRLIVDSDAEGAANLISQVEADPDLASVRIVRLPEDREPPTSPPLLRFRHP